MLLRTRITLIAAGGFLALVACFWIASLVRDRLEHDRIAKIAVEVQSALWREIVAVQSSDLQQKLTALEVEPAFRTAVAAGDRQGAVQAMHDAGVTSGADDLFVEVTGFDREVMFADGPGAGRGILDASTMDQAFAGKQLAGLRALSASRIVVVATMAMEFGEKGKAVVVLGRSIQPALERLAASISASTNVLSLRGRLAASSDEALWNALNLTIPPRQPLLERASLGARTFLVTSVPIDEIAGGTLGALVTVKDDTLEWAAQQTLRSTAIAVTAALVVVGLLGLNLFLRFAFRPLEDAIGVLEALSRGDTSLALDHAGHDEIGRISQAVRGLRADAQELAEARRQRERVRRRQEAVISTELKALADSIDAADREEVLALLETPEGGAGEEGLRRVARVLHDLSRRIVEQHTRLSSMVVELREALITKTKLAGLQQELEIARQVQLAILPKALPDDARVAVDGHMTPAREVGGDFYDFFMIDASTLGFVVADVSGKGIPAALFMAISRTLLRSTAQFERSPARTIRRVNDLLALENDQMLFVTMFYGVLDLDSGHLTYVNAGHNLPYRLRSGSALEPLASTSGMAVAVLEGFVYQEREVRLARGDTLFLFTDGVTEAFDVDEKPYGEARLEALLSDEDLADVPVEALSQSVLSSIRAFERGAPQADDITCLAVRYLGGHNAPLL